VQTDVQILSLLGIAFHFDQGHLSVAIFVEAFEVALKGGDVSAFGISDVFFQSHDAVFVDVAGGEDFLGSRSYCSPTQNVRYAYFLLLSFFLEIGAVMGGVSKKRPSSIARGSSVEVSSAMS
jgi:hypothetical protein